MNFRDFQQYREELLASNPELVDLAETNLWRSLAPLIPQIAREQSRLIHRCDLAKQWTRTLGLPADAFPRALISAGVRDSLSLLFPWLAERQIQMLIPADVYPVYGELAKIAGLKYQTFPTVPEVVLPESGDCILLPNPLKPAGRWLQTQETEALLKWLGASSNRRLILDAVYTFDIRFHDSTLALYGTGQTIMLHSLSKGWLCPQVFGVALVPQIDLPQLAPLFRNHIASQENLWKAQQLLERYSTMPCAVGEELRIRRVQLLQQLPAAIRRRLVPLEADMAGYLLTVSCGHEELLKQHRILSVPLSVFGAAGDEFSVLSTLGNPSAVPVG